MVKLQHKIKGKEQFMITIPKSLALQKGWKQGIELDLRFNERG
ncbi:unnamed protein product, partial [marine sediment metagenome]